MPIYKYELHAHTSECDPYAMVSAAQLVRRYQEAGYDGIVITDHYMDLFFHSWFPEELKGLSPGQQIKRWLKGYDTAREAGERLGFTVLPGAEVRFDGQPNDYLLYGLDAEVLCAAPRLHALKDLQELLAVLPQEVCVVQAHPFRDGMEVKKPRGLFGMEVYNGGTDSFRNAMARLFAEHYGLAMTSGSDIHGLGQLAKGGILTERKIKTPKDLREVLRSGAYALIE